VIQSSEVNEKAKKMAFRFFVFFLIFNFDFNEIEIKHLESNGWKTYRDRWHIAPKGWGKD
jgi:hypothetical protein